MARRQMEANSYETLDIIKKVLKAVLSSLSICIRHSWQK